MAQRRPVQSAGAAGLDLRLEKCVACGSGQLHGLIIAHPWSMLTKGAYALAIYHSGQYWEMTEDLALVIEPEIFKLCANCNYRTMLSVETNVAHNPEPEAALSREE
ncbi:hypothetical protein [Agrobacterium vitis]|uniref:hypothetical protein n=1 Tax=Agrobacterium vitis TaxID=373 RepID=UPI003D29CF18